MDNSLKNYFTKISNRCNIVSRIYYIWFILTNLNVNRLT